MEAIVYTVSNLNNKEVRIRTRDKRVGLDDINIVTHNSYLFNTMATLTMKYNNRGIAVMFEVE